MKRILTRSAQLLAGLIGTSVCLWLVVRSIDWSTAAATIGRAHPGWLVLALVMLTGGYLCRIGRWWLMLRSSTPAVPMSACAGPFVASVALNNVLPFRAGDVVRVFGFRRELGVPASRVLSTMVIERLLDLTALLTVFAVTLIGADTSGLPTLLGPTMAAITAVCLLMLVCVMVVPRPLERLAAAWLSADPERAHPIRVRLGNMSRDFLTALADMGSPRVVVRLLLLSLVAWVFEGAVFAAVAHALSASVGIGAWFALATGTLGTLIPSTPGYVGTFDYLTMLGFMAYQMPASQAAVIALGIHLVLWAPLTLVGLTWLLLSKLKWTEAATSQSVGLPT